MNLKDRTENYNERIQMGNSKELASFQSWREYIFTKVHLFDIIEKVINQDYKVIANEIDNKRLSKRAIFGTLEFTSSYCVMFGGFISGLVTKNPTLMLSSGLVGILLNWDGESKIVNIDKRCKELGIKSDDLIKNYKV